MNFPTFGEKPAQIQETITKAHIGVLGAKGGIGATTLAINLAFALSQRCPSRDWVTLIDCNLQQPDAALMLACKPRHSILELLKRTGRLDESTIDACSTPINCETNLRLLTPPLDGTALATHCLTDISQCLPSLSECSGVSVLDLPNKLDRHLVSVLDLCHVIVLVIEPTMTAIAAGKRWLRIFSELGYSRDDLVIALNRAGGRFKFIEQKANESFTGVELIKIPNNYWETETCAIEGLPLLAKSQKGPYSKALQQLASSVSWRARERGGEIGVVSQAPSVSQSSSVHSIEIG